MVVGCTMEITLKLDGQRRVHEPQPRDPPGGIDSNLDIIIINATTIRRYPEILSLRIELLVFNPSCR